MADKILIEDTRILFKNFGGRTARFNNNGQRNFNVVIPEADAKAMERDGWPIKWLDPKEEGDVATPILKVVVKYSNGNGPRVTTIGSRGQTHLDEEAVSALDYMYVEKADVEFRAYDYDYEGRKGRAAYLNAIVCHINESALDLKYANVPDATQGRQEDPWKNDENVPF